MSWHFHAVIWWQFRILSSSWISRKKWGKEFIRVSSNTLVPPCLDLCYEFKDVAVGDSTGWAHCPFYSHTRYLSLMFSYFLNRSLYWACSQRGGLLPSSHETAFHDFASQAECLQLTPLDESRLCKDTEPAACYFYLYTRHRFNFIAPICFLSLITVCLQNQQNPLKHTVH